MVKDIASDADLTIFMTHEVAFAPRISEAVLYLSNEFKVEFKPLEDRFYKHWFAAQALFGVQPDWLIAETTRLLKLSLTTKDQPFWEKFQRILSSIYDEKIPVYDDVIPALEELKRREIGVGVITQSEPYWAQKKFIDNPKIAELVVHNRPYCTPTHTPKLSKFWRTGVTEYFGFALETTAGIGDSIPSDIIPGIQAGLSVMFYLNRHDDHGYSPSRKGVLPVEAYEIDSFAGVLTYIDFMNSQYSALLA